MVLDDDGHRHVATTRKTKERRSSPWSRAIRRCATGRRRAVAGADHRILAVPPRRVPGVQRSGDAVGIRAGASGTAPGAQAWDLYGGAGLFAAVLAEAVGERGLVLSVGLAPGGGGGADRAGGPRPGARRLESVRRFPAARNDGADLAVLDPPRAGAGKEIIELLAGVGVPKVIHIGCEAASFARDIGLYQRNGYHVETIRVFDAFPLTHHVECFALLSR